MTHDKSELLALLAEVVELQPTRTVGQIMRAAMDISRGQLQSNPAFAGDAELIEGLRALIPAEWEKK